MSEIDRQVVEDKLFEDCAPRPLAEQISPQLADAAMRRYETRRMPPGLFHSAWNHVEYAINELDDRELIQYYFDIAHMLLGNIMQHTDSTEDLRLGALTLGSYMPLLMRRATRETVSDEDCEGVYKSLGSALQYQRPLSIEEPPQWRMAEVAVLCLSARMKRPDLLLYPASPREEQSAKKKFNHDSYFYTGQDKLPIQQKLVPTQKVYDECITILTLNPIIEKASKVTQLHSGETLAEKVNYLLSLVIADANNHDLTRSEYKFLNFMTEAVAAHHAGLTSRAPVRRSA